MKHFVSALFTSGLPGKRRQHRRQRIHWWRRPLRMQHWIPSCRELSNQVPHRRTLRLCASRLWRYCFKKDMFVSLPICATLTASSSLPVCVFQIIHCQLDCGFCLQLRQIAIVSDKRVSSIRCFTISTCSISDEPGS